MMNNKKYIQILIPNGPSPANIGDVAILESLLKLVKNKFPLSKITIHAMDPIKHKKILKVKQALYYWVMFEDKNMIKKAARLIIMITNYLSLRFFKKTIFNLNKTYLSLIDDYKKAQLIILIGGGYLRSKKRFSQSLNIIMLLSMFLYASLFNAKTIVAPISVGPFSYKWHERFVVWVLRKMDTIMVREEISFKLLKNYQIKNLILSSDLGLLGDIEDTKSKGNKFILGFSVRNWLKGKKNEEFIEHFVNGLIKFSHETKAIIRPILQVDALMYGENDRELTSVITKRLKENSVDILEKETPHILEEKKRAYSQIDMLLGMRMHSNILAALVGTPFVAISYEYKTQGIAKQLGVEEYVVQCDKLTDDKLFKLLMKAHNNRKHLKEVITKSVQLIQERENKRWMEILS